MEIFPKILAAFGYCFLLHERHILEQILAAKFKLDQETSVLWRGDALKEQALICFWYLLKIDYLKARKWMTDDPVQSDLDQVIRDRCMDKETSSVKQWMLYLQQIKLQIEMLKCALLQVFVTVAFLVLRLRTCIFYYGVLEIRRVWLSHWFFHRF